MEDPELLELTRYWQTLGPRAKKVALMLLHRLSDGALLYHDDFSNGRQWAKEALEEDLDGMIYRSARLVQIAEEEA